jgi:hypothetical protein
MLDQFHHFLSLGSFFFFVLSKLDSRVNIRFVLIYANLLQFWVWNELYKLFARSSIDIWEMSSKVSLLRWMCPHIGAQPDFRAQVCTLSDSCLFRDCLSKNCAICFHDFSPREPVCSLGCASEYSRVLAPVIVVRVQSFLLGNASLSFVTYAYLSQTHFLSIRLISRLIHVFAFVEFTSHKELPSATMLGCAVAPRSVY